MLFYPDSLKQCLQRRQNNNYLSQAIAIWDRLFYFKITLLSEIANPTSPVYTNLKVWETSRWCEEKNVLLLWRNRSNQSSRQLRRRTRWPRQLRPSWTSRCRPTTTCRCQSFFLLCREPFGKIEQVPSVPGRYYFVQLGFPCINHFRHGSLD